MSPKSLQYQVPGSRISMQKNGATGSWTAMLMGLDGIPEKVKPISAEKAAEVIARYNLEPIEYEPMVYVPFDR